MKFLPRVKLLFACVGFTARDGAEVAMRPVSVAFAAVAAFVLTFTTGAQSNDDFLQRNNRPPSDNNGWSRAGAALGANSDDAFTRGAIQGAEMRRILEESRAAQSESDRIRAQTAQRLDLVEIWKASGLSPSEAVAVASTYVLDERQIAITEHVKREGWRSAIDPAWKAYHEYNYQLANQLLVAARIANNIEHQQADAQAANP